MVSTNNPDIGLASLLFRRAFLTPHRKAMTFEGTTRTFAEFEDRILKVANALTSMGIKAGDRVGYLGMNHSAFLETLYASACIGEIGSIQIDVG